MLEVVYRIYEVADNDIKEQNKNDIDYFSSISKSENIELLMDCLICDNREHFKEIIKDTYGNIPFRYSKKLNAGDLYCVIIGEHCYNTERYFNKITFTCDFCGSTVETYSNSIITLSDWEISTYLYNIQEYKEKHFCCNKCKDRYIDKTKSEIKPDEDSEFFITQYMFTEKVSGYIYKITKKSTGEFYIGQTKYAPVFRWGQHLKTNRFPIENITDYQFEVIEIVPQSENILEHEKFYIQEYYKRNPDKSLNIACTKLLE